MAFKDNIGMTEELKVQLVDTSTTEEAPLDPLPSTGPGVYAFVGSPVHVRWIKDTGEFVRDETFVFVE